MVTARDAASDIVRGFVTGANDYITKPFTRNELLIRIENQLAVKQLLDLEHSMIQDLQQEETGTNKSLFQRSVQLKQLALQTLAWERLIKDDLEVAHVFQKRLMSLPGQLSGLDFYVFYHPLLRLSGDIYDIVKLKTGIIRIFLADATGHGITASLNTVKILSEYAAVKETMQTPQQLLTFLNSRFIQLFRDYQIVFTCLIADINIHDGTIELVSAGHPAACIIDNGTIDFIKPRGPIIGLTGTYEYQQVELSLKNGDIVLFYTDGLLDLIHNQYTDTKNSHVNEQEILKERIRTAGPIQSMEKLCTSLLVGGNKDPHEAINDDITIIALRKE